jgi:hypothetical protein
MRSRLQRSLTVLALYAVVAHVTLLGFSPIPAGAFAVINPFALICHTIAPAPGKQPQGTLHFIPSRAIDHCNLASAAAPPPAPEIALNTPYAPVRVLHILRLASVSARPGLASDPRLARAPPLFA